MKKLKKQNQNGFILWHGILLIAVIAVISFIGGSVFSAQQRMAQDKSKATPASDAQAVSEIEVKKQAVKTEQQKPVEIPAEEKKVEPAPVPAPVPVPKPTPVKTTPEKTVAKEPVKVGISASSQVGADAIILTASLPAVYSGTCKALVKHMDGSNHRWLEAGFTSANSCSINVPRSTVTTATEWQYYLYFNDSSWTVKGDSGRHTFVL